MNEKFKILQTLKTNVFKSIFTRYPLKLSLKKKKVLNLP